MGMEYVVVIIVAGMVLGFLLGMLYLMWHDDEYGSASWAHR